MSKKKKRTKHYNTGWGGSWSSTIFVSTCKHHPTFLFNLGELSVWAADMDGVKHAPKDAVVLNCTGISRHDHHFGRFSQRLSQHLVIPNETLQLDWTDGAAPPVRAQFWRELPFALIDEGVKDLVVHCVGGHGRTGTALASMLIMVMGMTGPEAIRWVRDKYCKSAIETSVQERYLFFLNEPYSNQPLEEPEPDSQEEDTEEKGKGGNVYVFGDDDEDEEVAYDCSSCASPRMQFGPCYNCGWEDIPKSETQRITEWSEAMEEGLREIRDEDEEDSDALIPPELLEEEIPKQVDVLDDVVDNSDVIDTEFSTWAERMHWWDK